MQGGDLFEKDGLGARDVLNGLARHGIRQEADEIAGMPGLECDADFAVGLESADPRPMSGARVDNHERPSGRIEFDSRRRNDPHETVVDRPIKRLSAEDQFHFVVEHMWHGLGQMLPILITALAHRVPEQDATLGGIHQIFHGRSKHAELRRKRAH